jgi:hypothetical protein
VDNIEEKGRQSQGQINKKTSPGIFDQRTTVFTKVNNMYVYNW